jgi:hypothetical protein
MDLEAAQAAMTDAGMQLPVLAKPMSTGEPFLGSR